MHPYFLLLIAVFAEIVATSALQASMQFSRLIPSAVSVLFYVLAFYCLALSLKSIPLGVAYAIWSGVGLVCITLIGWVLFGQKLDLAALIGIGFIGAGCLVIHLFSNAAVH